MKPPHKLFLSSLKQVEKRLKLDGGNLTPPQPPPSLPQSTESLDGSSPIYFYNQTTNASSTLQDNSIEQPPQEFLSYNDTNEFQPNKKVIHQSNDSKNNFSETSTADDIDSMIRILRLTDFNGEGGPEMPDVGDDEFYDKIVKAKGPKNKTEVGRLDGWIKYLLNNGGGCEEPLRLGHLIMAKAAFESDHELEFPSTIDEFLQNDPPPSD